MLLLLLLLLLALLLKQAAPAQVRKKLFYKLRKLLQQWNQEKNITLKTQHFSRERTRGERSKRWRNITWLWGMIKEDIGMMTWRWDMPQVDS